VGGLCPDPQTITGLLLDKYKSIYTNDETFGLAGQIAPLTHSIINRAAPGLAGP
jgi:hypothetical protein